MSNAWEVIKAKTKKLDSRCWKMMDIYIDVFTDLREKKDEVNRLRYAIYEHQKAESLVEFDSEDNAVESFIAPYC